MLNLDSNLVPDTAAIAQDLLRVVGDVLDIGYSESGTLADGRYIHVKRTDCFEDSFVVTIGPKQTKMKDIL